MTKLKRMMNNVKLIEVMLIALMNLGIYEILKALAFNTLVVSPAK
jgi:hypothetical protein